MEDSPAVEEDGCPFSAPSSFVPFSSPSFMTMTGPDFATDSILESKAISMASNDCSSAVSSSAEASPAKPAEECSLKSSGMSIINMSDFPPWSTALPSTTFGGPEPKNDFPPVLTLKGVSVTLENNNIWKQFCECGTEMILTKQGRRMFPYCRYRLSGLDPEKLYSLVLSIVPSGQFKYRWSTSKWEPSGAAEHQNQGLIRAFSHHYSPCRGSEWMSCLVSFYKLKLTNNFQDQDGHMILHSMHRYIPRLHIIPLPDGDVPTADKPVVVGPESMTFTFPQTEFMAVTTYQNFRITQLKINHNPFAKGFREDGHNSRLNRISTPVMKMEMQPEDFNPAEPGEHEEEIIDLSTASEDAPPPSSNTQETRHVLKPIMSDLSGSGVSYVPCIRGKHALGEIVLINKHPGDEPKENSSVTGTLNVQQGLSVTSQATSITPGSSTSTPVSTRPYRKKKRKTVKRRWGIDYRPKMWRATAAAAAATSTVVPSPSLTVAMQPELDDIEGMLFASFTTKEALEVHARNTPASVLSTESLISSTKPTQPDKKMEVNPETMEEKMARLESLLLNDLSVLKHRQAIHPVLQEVGLKLSSLDPTVPIDLNYLGVHLPLPSPVLTEQSSTAPSPADDGLPFISRTGKTSDMTKIKGWRNKFSRIQETSASNCDVSPKNLSAFCSHMLDEYLDSEAQQIRDRAAAFSTNPESSVTYQLPAKSSSYVKTLDSVLRHQNAASRVSEAPNRPCPLSRKPLLYTSLRSQASSLTSPEPQSLAEPQSTSSSTHPDSSSGYSYSSYISRRLLTNRAAVHKTSAEMLGQNQAWAQKASHLSKDQLFLEIGALNQGLSRTHLTPKRLKIALTAMLTQQTLPHQISNLPLLPRTDEGPECGLEFCRLGCLCSSLQHQEREPVHCRRPECMFDCTCSNTLTNMEQTAQSRLGFDAPKLWNCNIWDNDSDALYVPKSATSLVPAKTQKRSRTHPVPLIREEDKDPVYKFLESKLTCARVRAFNSGPPPVVTLDTESHAAVFKPRVSTKPLRFTQTLSKKDNRAVLTSQKAAIHCLLLVLIWVVGVLEPSKGTPTKRSTKKEKPSQENTSSEKEPRKQIHIHSLCQWKKDRKKVLDGLCERMNQNRLHQCFYIGPYFIRPVAKVTLQKPSGTVITHRVQIRQSAQVSDCEEESDEYDDLGSDGNADAEEEDELAEDPEMRYGVAPFLRGVVAAGSLSAKKRAIGYKATGLIEVNGKHYNYARLALGNMGSLHPANRLAAFVTGRLPSPKEVSQIQGSVIKTATAGSFHKTSACKILPAGTEQAQKTTLQPAVELLLKSLNKGSISLQQPSPNSPAIYPVQLFIPIQPQSQNSSTSLTSSLTVSPSLKNPAFLAKSGTYSFRICPPSNQAVGGQNPPGVVLPGGFTLIELPKPGTDGATQQAKHPTHTTETDSTAQKKDTVSNLSLLAKQLVGFETLSKVKDLLRSRLAEPGSSSGLMSDENLPSVENSEVDNRQTPSQESNFDHSSEDLSSEFSEDEEFGYDDGTVDIETVEEGKPEEVIVKMREDALKNSNNIRTSTDEPGGLDEHNGVNSRRNHKTTERQRRFKHGELFDKLREVLNSHSKTSMVSLLSMAVEEVKKINETSRRLEEEKEKLIQDQSAFVRKLSLESGKSEVLIQNKLKEIFERQKQREKNMKWKPVFSHLLESKAALLQATAPQSHLLPQQCGFSPPPHTQLPNTKTDQNDLQMLLTLLHPNKTTEPAPSGQHPVSQAALLPGQTITVAPSQQGELPSTESLEAHRDPDQASYQTKNLSPSKQDPKHATQNGPKSGSSAPIVLPPQLLASLPLIRSKTGRLILPSSLKPIGQGFYTLMMMEPKQKEEQGEAGSSANVQPSDGDSYKSLEKNTSPFDQPSNVENKAITEDKAETPDSDPRTPGEMTPLPELDSYNQPVVPPKLDFKDSDLGVIQPLAAAHLCFNPVTPPPQVNLEPSPSPPNGCRRRGRPLKKKGPPCTEVKTKEIDVSNQMPQLIGESESDKLAVETRNMEVKNKISEVAWYPTKRGRGRPPKKGLANPSAKQAISDDDDSPIWFSIGSYKSPNSTKLEGEVYTSRPLTRGSLGKDFPSAKKRSWIDMEKELEPDLEYA